MPGATAFQDDVRRMSPVSAPDDQRDGVAEVVELLHRAPSDAESFRLVSPTGEETPVPVSLVLLLERVAEVLAAGDAVTVVPVGKELTTQQAADILNVSRQYLVRLLDDGAMPFTRTGTHRRVRMDDVVAFKRQRDRERAAALDDLAALTQDFGGYPEIPGE